MLECQSSRYMNSCCNLRLQYSTKNAVLCLFMRPHVFNETISMYCKWASLDTLKLPSFPVGMGGSLSELHSSHYWVSYLFIYPAQLVAESLLMETHSLVYMYQTALLGIKSHWILWGYSSTTNPIILANMLDII